MSEEPGLTFPYPAVCQAMVILQAQLFSIQALLERLGVSTAEEFRQASEDWLTAARQTLELISVEHEKRQH